MFILKIGATLASFHISEYIEVDKMFVKIIWRGRMTDSSHNSNIWPEIPSGPVALLGFILKLVKKIHRSLYLHN